MIPALHTISCIYLYRTNITFTKFFYYDIFFGLGDHYKICNDIRKQNREQKVLFGSDATSAM
jgi:hypothetical protein